MEILDEAKTLTKPKDPIFSIVSIIMPLLFIGMMIYIGKGIDETGEVEYGFTKFIIAITILIIGVLSSVISFVRKERLRAIRWIGSFLNLFIVITLVIVIIFDLQ